MTKRNSKKNLYIIASLLLLCIVSICGSCSERIHNNEYILVTDMVGDTVRIAKNPKKVACVSRTTYDLLVAFGLQDKIDGAYKNIYDNPWVDVINKNAKNEYRYEYEESYETFLSRNVDLVFAPEKYIADNLRAKGINALCISLYGNPTYDEYVYFFADTIIKLWDDKEVHEKVIKWKSEVENAIEECSLHKSTKQKKLYYVRADKDRGVEYTDTKGFFTEFAFRKLGYDFAGATINVTKPSKEEICKYNPDVFVIGGIFQNKIRQQLKNDAVYKNLPAVKNDNIYTIPIGITSFEQISITTPIFFYDMSNKLNKTNYDVYNMLKETYKEYFNVKISEEQIKYMLDGRDINGNTVIND